MEDNTKIKSGIVMGDFHINSTVAVIKPGIQVGEFICHPNYTQRWLWECLMDARQKIVELPGKKILFLNGDAGEVDERQRSYQVMTNNPAVIQTLIYETLEPILDVVDEVYVIRGTEAHTGKSGWIEEAFANDLVHVVRCEDRSVSEDVTEEQEEFGARILKRLKKKSAKEINEKPPEEKKITYASWHQVRIGVAGVKMDICHHTSMGKLPWTAPNVANKLAVLSIFDYTEHMKAEIPNLVFRSHNHMWADSYDNYDVVRAVCMAAWTTATEYVYRIGMENRLADIGFAYTICENGDYDLKKVKYPHKDSRRVWRLTA